jgi:hypothetical protein
MRESDVLMWMSFGFNSRAFSPAAKACGKSRVEK